MKLLIKKVTDGVKETPQFLKRQLRRRNVIIGLAVLAIIVLVVAKKGGNTTEEIYTVVKGDLSRTVPASGEVTSDVDLKLSFQKSGKVERVNVVAGQKVSSGTILATLVNGKERADVAKANANLAQAENLLSVLQTELDNAKKNLDATIKAQDGIVANYYRTLLSSDLEATPTAKETIKTAPIVKGLYLGDNEGYYRVKLESDSGSYTTNAAFSYDGLEDSEEDTRVILGKSIPLGTYGLSLQFPDDFSISGYDTDWNIDIPNTDGDSYVTNYTNYINAIANRDLQLSVAEAAVDQINAQLLTYQNLGTTPDILLARSEVASATAILEDTYIRTPSAGTVTRVDISAGDPVEAYKDVVDLKGLEALFVEAYVNEASIVNVHVGQTVKIVFDAFGPDQVFTGTISSLDLSPKVEEGVVNYKILVALDEDVEGLRTGMTATLDIEVFAISDALYVPKKALILEEGEFYLKKKIGDDTEQVRVTLGREGDGGLVEIVSGVSDGDSIILQ